MKPKMLIIGITGGIGSGKSAVTQRFEELGIKVVDADIAARQVVAAGSEALVAIKQHFGKEIILPNGELNRPALREIVFKTPEERKWLENLTHPLIRSLIIEELQSATSPYAILVSPLLIESGQYHLVNKVLVIDVPEAVQIERTTLRDDNSDAQVRAIMDAQLSRQDRLKHANDIIYNDSTLDHLDQQVAALHKQYIALSESDRAVQA